MEGGWVEDAVYPRGGNGWEWRLRGTCVTNEKTRRGHVAVRTVTKW